MSMMHSVWEELGWFRAWRRRVIESFNSLQSARALHPGERDEQEFQLLNSVVSEEPPGGKNAA